MARRKQLYQVRLHPGRFSKDEQRDMLNRAQRLHECFPHLTWGEISDRIGGVQVSWLRENLDPNFKPDQAKSKNPVPKPAADRRDFTARMMGDPLPERSALAQKRAAERRLNRGG